MSCFRAGVIATVPITFAAPATARDRKHAGRCCPVSLRGFTLIEIIVVLALLAFSTSLVFGLNVQQRDKFLLRDFGVSLGAYLQLTRSTALTQGRSGACFLDPDTGRVQSPILDRALTVPAGLGLAAPAMRAEGDGPVLLMEFYMDGSASGGEIALEYNGYSGLITVNPLLGDIEYSF